MSFDSITFIKGLINQNINKLKTNYNERVT